MKANELLKRILKDASMISDSGLYSHIDDESLARWFGDWQSWIDGDKLKEGADYLYIYFNREDSHEYIKALGEPTAYAVYDDEFIGLWEIED